MGKKVKLEICVDSVESALAAQVGGADGVELCAGLSEEGTTPSAGMVGILRRELSIRLNVMIRPHGGYFSASGHDIEVMKRDIGLVGDLGADGVVFGLLRSDRNADLDAMGLLCELARPLQVTFHRAIDLVSDPIQFLPGLISIGIGRVLTSGGSDTALGGADRIRRIVVASAGQMIVAAAGRIDRGNVREVITRTGADEVHLGSAVSRTDVISTSPLPLRSRRVDPRSVAEVVNMIPR